MLDPPDLQRPAGESLLAAHDISKVLVQGPGSGGLLQEQLLVDIPAAASNVEMLSLLVARCNCTLSYKVGRKQGSLGKGALHRQRGGTASGASFRGLA